MCQINSDGKWDIVIWKRGLAVFDIYRNTEWGQYDTVVQSWCDGKHLWSVVNDGDGVNSNVQFTDDWTERISQWLEFGRDKSQIESVVLTSLRNFRMKYYLK